AVGVEFDRPRDDQAVARVARAARHQGARVAHVDVVVDAGRGLAVARHLFQQRHVLPRRAHEVDAGPAVAGVDVEARAVGRARGRRIGLGRQARDQIARGVDQQARRPAVRPLQDVPARGRGRQGVDPRRLHRRAGHGHRMTVGAGQHHDPARRGGVQIGGGQEALLGPMGLDPAAPDDDALGVGLGPGAEPLHGLDDGGGAFQVQRRLAPADAVQVGVAVGEAGEQRRPLQIHHLQPLGRGRAVRRADIGDAPVAHDHHLGGRSGFVAGHRAPEGGGRRTGRRRARGRFVPHRGLFQDGVGREPEGRGRGLSAAAGAGHAQGRARRGEEGRRGDHARHLQRPYAGARRRGRLSAVAPCGGREAHTRGDGAAPVAFGPQGLEQGQDKFATALAGQEAVGGGDSGLIAMRQGDLQPGEGQLGVALVGQVQGLFQIGQLGGGQPVGTGLEPLGTPGQEALALLGVPVLPVDGRGRALVAKEGLGLGVHSLEGVRHRRDPVGRHPRLIDPVVQLQLGLQSGVALDQVLADVGQEADVGHGLEGVTVEIAAQPGVERRTPDDALDGAQHGRALLIGHARQTVVGVTSGQVDVQLGVVRIGDGHFRRQLAPAQNLLLQRAVTAVEGFHDPVLEIDRGAFVQPDVLPAGVGHQVARPAVRQFVGHQRDQRLVADDHGRGGEGQARVLHAAERERRRQHQHVVAAPAVWAVQRLGGVDHARGRLQFGVGGFQSAGLGPDAGAAVERGEGDVADGHGHQIGRDRMIHVEAPGLLTRSGGLALRRQVLGGHDHGQVGGGDDAGRIGLADAGAVLGRDPGAGQDGLALAEQIGFLAARRLLRGQPLQGRGIRAGRIVDDDLLDFGPGEGGQVDGQGLTLDGVDGAQLIAQRAPLRVAHAADVQVLGVQHHLGRADAAGDVQRRRTRQGLGGEVGGQVQRHMTDARLGRAGVGVDVVGIGESGRSRGRGDERRHRHAAFGGLGGGAGAKRCGSLSPKRSSLCGGRQMLGLEQSPLLGGQHQQQGDDAQHGEAHRHRHGGAVELLTDPEAQQGPADGRDEALGRGRRAGDMAHRLHGHRAEITGDEAEAEHLAGLQAGEDPQAVVTRIGDGGVQQAEADEAEQGGMGDQARAQLFHQPRVQDRGQGDAAGHQGEDGGEQAGRLEHVEEDLLRRVDEGEQGAADRRHGQGVAHADAAAQGLTKGPGDALDLDRHPVVGVQGLGQARGRPDQEGPAEQGEEAEDPAPGRH
uniref:PE-PGRS family protein n=1 Tax=Parastrongyloides trichosuri TaxID=131310 RepID=A0A0N4YZX7_PARTI